MLTISSPVVILQTATFNIQIYHLLPTQFWYEFVWVSDTKQCLFP